MIKLLYLFCALFALSSCSKHYIQIFDTSTTNTSESSGYYVFETDSVKITYDFWESKGAMSFSVFNKLDKPIYIDWKNSSFIHNSNKLNYWIDEQQSTLVSYYGNYFYNGPLIKPGYTLNSGVQASSSRSIKPERVTFIPPKSNYSRVQFHLFPVDYFNMDPKKITKTIVPRDDNPKKKTIVYQQSFDFATTPLHFRNFLAFSFAENSSNFFYIDNEFYLKSVKEMDFRHFHGKLTKGPDGNVDYEKKEKKKTSFYIQLATPNSIDYRTQFGIVN